MSANSRSLTNGKFGQALPRIEDRKFLTGRGCYIDDISLAGIAHGVIVYSNHAHARIRSIDTTRALRAPGVLAVLTGTDIAALGLNGLPPLFMPEDTGGPKGYRTTRPLLAHDIVRHVGDRVAFCVAESLAQARNAAELIEIDYDVLTSATTLAGATEKGAPALWPSAARQCLFHAPDGRHRKHRAGICKGCASRTAQPGQQPNSSQPDGASWRHRTAQPSR